VLNHLFLRCFKACRDSGYSARLVNQALDSISILAAALFRGAQRFSARFIAVAAKLTRRSRWLRDDWRFQRNRDAAGDWRRLAPAKQLLPYAIAADVAAVGHAVWLAKSSQQTAANRLLDFFRRGGSKPLFRLEDDSRSDDRRACDVAVNKRSGCWCSLRRRSVSGWRGGSVRQAVGILPARAGATASYLVKPVSSTGEEAAVLSTVAWRVAGVWR